MTEADLRGEIAHLIEKWRENAARWRGDDDNPQGCEWADTADDCAGDLRALLDRLPRQGEGEQQKDKDARVDKNHP